jgi:hypothetical protein
MNHEPSNYIASVHLNFQQLMEIRKAITDRILHLALRDESENDLPMAWYKADLETLHTLAVMLDVHIDKACHEWEAKVAQDEAREMTDEAIEKWLGDE